MHRSNWWDAHTIDVLLGILLCLYAFFLLLLLVLLWAISPQDAQHSTLSGEIECYRLPLPVLEVPQKVQPIHSRHESQLLNDYPFLNCPTLYLLISKHYSMHFR